MDKTSLTPLQHAVFYVTLALTTFMIVLDYSIANIAIPYIAGDLGVSNDQGTYVITAFAVGNAIGLAMTGWAAKRIGEIRLFCLSIVLFTLLSWMCGLSISLTMLIIARFIQGFVSGPIIPLSQSLLLQFGTKESRNRDLAVWSTIIISAPVIGPILGGYISEWYHWPWIFYINLPVGVFCAITIWLLVRHLDNPPEKGPVDLSGMIFLALGVTCLQILLDKGQQWDWHRSRAICTLGVATVVSFTYLILIELKKEKPFLDLRLFRYPTFSLSILCLMVSYAIYFGVIVVGPLWLQMYMGYTATWAGVAVSSLGLGPVCLSWITPFLIKKFGHLFAILIGFVLFTIGCFYATRFTTDVDIQTIAFSRFLFGLGFVSYISPLIGLSVLQIPEKSYAQAAGLFHFIRAMVGGFGTSLFTTLWLRRTIFHHERLASLLTPFNPSTPSIFNQPSRALLNNALDAQAALLSINDTFFLMGWLYVGLIVLIVGYQIVISSKAKNKYFKSQKNT